jgi:uncharacterized protein with PQ loop repeat
VSTEALRIVFGIAMVVLASLYALPQWLRVRRTGSVEGVSLAATSNAFISCTAWVIYAVVLGDVWVLLTCLAALPSLGATTWILVRNHASRGGMATTWIWTAALVAGGVMAPWTTMPIDLLLGASILWYVAPAAVMAWTSADVTGISAGAWIVLLADAVLWLLYSLLAGIFTGILYAVFAGGGALVVLARLAWRWGPDCGVCPPLAACTCAPIAA